ncbi:MAG: arsenate reductase ArsC, partial [Nitrospiraceae bacterium]
MPENRKFRVMFLCTGNSCRSHIAEGFAREMGKGMPESFSAGIAPCHVHPLAIRVMHEKGINISRHRSKAIDPDLLGSMDFVITLCSHADRYCPPVPPGVRRVHIPVNDPVGTIGSEEKILLAFRKTRDEIEEKLRGMISDIEKVMMILSLKRGAQGSRGNDELSMINLQSSIKEYSL